jgi:thiosulfate/3-mercaptopyruvate sulfurtransferase
MRNSGRKRSHSTFLLFLLSLALSVTAGAQFRTAPASNSAESLRTEQLISPEELVKVLESKSTKPLVLNVGPRTLFAQAHIPNAEYVGQGSDPATMDALKQRLKSLPKTKSIVLYCGCCPWAHCPNVAPAFHQLVSLGFTNVKVLYIPTNLGVDWVYKGYPTVKGQ